jgi:hypothetical protein
MDKPRPPKSMIEASFRSLFCLCIAKHRGQKSHRRPGTGVIEIARLLTLDRPGKTGLTCRREHRRTRPFYILAVA